MANLMEELLLQNAKINEKVNKLNDRLQVIEATCDNILNKSEFGTFTNIYGESVRIRFDSIVAFGIRNVEIKKDLFSKENTYQKALCLELTTGNEYWVKPREEFLQLLKDYYEK